MFCFLALVSFCYLCSWVSFYSGVLIWKKEAYAPHPTPLRNGFTASQTALKYRKKYPILIAMVPWPCMNWCWWHSHVAVMPQWLKLLWGSVQRSLRRQRGQKHILTLQDKYFSGIFSVVGETPLKYTHDVEWWRVSQTIKCNFTF